jgi:hypothetical protein
LSWSRSNRPTQFPSTSPGAPSRRRKRGPRAPRRPSGDAGRPDSGIPLVPSVFYETSCPSIASKAKISRSRKKEQSP